MITTYVSRLRVFHGLIILLLCFLHACNTEDPLPLDPVRAIIAADNGNAGNGTDLEVFISEQFENQNIVEYRAIVAKASNATLSLADANSTPYYESASPDDIFPIQGIRFTEDSRDTDGDLLVENEDYFIGVLSVALDQKDRSNSLLLTENPFRLIKNNQVSNFTRAFEGGAGSLARKADGTMVMGDYNIIGELSGDGNESYSLFQFGNNGSVSVLRGPYRLLGGNYGDSEGNIYQSILNQARVLKIGPDSEQMTIVLDNFSVDGNDGVFVNDQQEMFVVNPGSATILKWDLETGENEVLVRLSDNPRGITGDEDGNLYISHNLESGLISKVTPDGEVSDFARVPTFRPEFYTIEYLMWVGYLTYHDDALYVAGMSTDRVYKVSMSGEVSVFAGSGTRGIPRGGALTANLNRPKGLVFSDDGSKLYISGSTDTQPQHTQASTPVQIWEVDIVEQ